MKEKIKIQQQQQQQQQQERKQENIITEAKRIKLWNNENRYFTAYDCDVYLLKFA